MKAPKATYSAAQLEILQGYTGSKNRDQNRFEVQRLADETGKTVPSVRAKLSVMGLYVTPDAAAKKGVDRITKAVKAQIIADVADLNNVERDSLAKTTNQVLDKIIKNMVHPLNELNAETEGFETDESGD